MVTPADVPDWGGGTQQGLYATPAVFSGVIAGGATVHLIPAVALQTVYLLSGNATSSVNTVPKPCTGTQVVGSLSAVTLVPAVAGQVPYLYAFDAMLIAGTQAAFYVLSASPGGTLKTFVANLNQQQTFDFGGVALASGAAMTFAMTQGQVTSQLVVNGSFLQLPAGEPIGGDVLTIRRTDGTILQHLTLSQNTSPTFDFHGGKLPVGQGVDLVNESTNATGTVKLNLVYLQG